MLSREKGHSIGSNMQNRFPNYLAIKSSLHNFTKFIANSELIELREPFNLQLEILIFYFLDSLLFAGFRLTYKL